MTPAEQTALEGLLGRPFAQTELDLLASHFGHEMRNDVAITALLSGWRTRIASRLIGEGTVSETLGDPAGPVFNRALRLMSEAPLADGATTQQVAMKARVEEAWRHLYKGDLDVGMAPVRSGIDAMVGVLPLTQEQADALKALAVVPHPFTLREVSWALNAAEGIPQE